MQSHWAAPTKSKKQMVLRMNRLQHRYLHTTDGLSCHPSQFSPITVCNKQHTDTHTNFVFCNDFLINVLLAQRIRFCLNYVHATSNICPNNRLVLEMYNSIECIVKQNDIDRLHVLFQLNVNK